MTTTIAFKEGARTYENTVSTLRRMGLETDEAALKAREVLAAKPQPEKPADPAPAAPLRLVPPVSFTPPTAVAKEEPTVSTREQRVVPPGYKRAIPMPKEAPVPFAQVEDQVKDLFNVPLRPGVNFKNIQGLLMKDGSRRYLCVADEKSCTDTYSTVADAKSHLGVKHPSENTLHRRAQASKTAAKPAAGAKKTIPAKTATPAKTAAPTTTTAPAAPTPAVMARKTAEAARPVSPAEVTRPQQAATPVDEFTPPADAAVNAAIGVFSEVIRGYHHYRRLTEQAEARHAAETAELRARLTELEQQLVRADASTRAAQLRATEAEKAKDAMAKELADVRQGLAALEGLRTLLDQMPTKAAA